MTEAGQYLLTGNGPIDAVWMRECVCLFRSQNVNIRKLVYQAGFEIAPDRESLLEIQFVLKPDEEDGHRDFLPRLNNHLSRLAWHLQSLEKL